MVQPNSTQRAKGATALLLYLWRATQENVYMTENKTDNDIEQASLVVTWAIVIAMVATIAVCTAGLAVRIFLLVSGL